MSNPQDRLFLTAGGGNIKYEFSRVPNAPTHSRWVWSWTMGRASTGGTEPSFIRAIVRAARSSLGARKWAGKTQAANQPAPKLTPVTELLVNCSFPMRPDAIAASDTCRRPANSAVVDPDNASRRYWRCEGHRGQMRPGQAGKAVESVPVRQQN